MPRGGHNRKSIAQHKADGTYRPGRHAPKVILFEPVERCAICGDPESDKSPLGFGKTGYGVCPGCVSGGVTFFDSINWDAVPDSMREQIIAEYLEDRAHEAEQHAS